MQSSLQPLQEMDHSADAPFSRPHARPVPHSRPIPQHNARTALREITNVAHLKFDNSENKSIKRQRIRRVLYRRILQREQPIVATPNHVLDIDKLKPGIGGAAHAENLKAAEARYKLHMTVEEILMRNSVDGLEMKINMPNTLFSWMYEVCHGIDLEIGTFVLATKLLQRYLALSDVPTHPDSLQLWAIIALYVSFKFNESSKRLDFNSMAALAEGEWSPSVLKAKEFEFLKVIDYRLCAPTPLHWCDRFAAASGVHDHRYHHHLETSVHRSILFYIHVTSSDLIFFDHSPSLIAAAAFVLARAVHGLPAWCRTFLHYAGHSPEAIIAEVDVLVSAVSRSSTVFSRGFGEGVDSEVTRLAIAIANGALESVNL